MKEKIIAILIIVSIFSATVFNSLVIADGIPETTVEIFNLDFEDAVAVPSISYAGQTFDFSSIQIGTSGATGSITTVQGIYGRNDTCIKVNSPANGNITNYSRYLLRVPDLSPYLSDIASGKMDISFNIAAPVSSVYPTSQFYIKGKDINGNYESKTIYFGLFNDNRVQFGSAILNSAWSADTWHEFTAEFMYGSNNVNFYKDGILLTTIQPFSSGYTFSGLGTANGGSMIFGVQHQAVAASSDVYAYFDDISLTTYNTGGIYYVPLSETFSSAQLNSIHGSFLSCTADVNYTPVTGVFGKSSNDTSIHIAKNDSPLSGSRDVFYQKQILLGGNFHYGGVAHFGVNIALDGDLRNMNKYLSLCSASGIVTTTYNSPGEFLKLTYGNLQIFTTSIPVNWQTQKWYNFDIYLYPGNGSNIKNKLWVYMNGKLMASDLEFDAINTEPYSQFTGINRIRLGQREWLVNDDGMDFDKQLYFDDIILEYYPSGIQCTAPEITVEAANGVADLSVVDTDTILLNSPLTVGDIVSRLNVTGAGVVKVVIDTITDAASTLPADGCYLKLEVSENAVYLLPIVSQIHRYTEDFNDYGAVQNAPYKYWTELNLNGSIGTGETKGLYGLGGKDEYDQSYVYFNGDTVLGTDVYIYNNIMYNLAPWNVEGKTTIEFSLLNTNLTDGNCGLNFQYHYTTPSNTIETSEITNAILMQGGNENYELCAFSNIGYGNGLSLGTWENNQWEKFALVLDTDNFTADVYVNGIPMQENIDILPSINDKTGYKITDIWRFKIDYHSDNNTKGSYMAFDDFDLYIGNYDIVDVYSLEKPYIYDGFDSVSKSRSIWSISSSSSISIEGNGLTLISDNNYGAYAKTGFYDLSQPFAIGFDASFNSGSSYAELSLRDKQASSSGHNISIIKIYNDSIIYLPNTVGSVTESAVAGEIINVVAIIDPVTNKISIYNNNIMKTSIIGEYDSFDFDCAYARLYSDAGSVSSTFYNVIFSADYSTYENVSLFAPKFKVGGMSTLTGEVICYNESQQTKNINLIVAQYNADENLINIAHSESIELTPQEFKHIFEEIDISNIVLGNKLVMMVWLSDNIIPLTSKVVYENIPAEYNSPSVPSEFEIMTNLRRSHPRLMVTDFASLKNNIENVGRYIAWYKDVSFYARAYKSATIPSYYDTDETRILGTMAFCKYVLYMSFAYQITGDETFAERVWDYMQAGAQWPDWGYSHFIDTADMLMAYGFAYDWLYDYWSSDQKVFIKNTLMSMGLNHALYQYRNGAGWLSYQSNWTTWCNAGVLVGALAVADEEENGAKLIKYALTNLQEVYGNFAPNGAWEEGVGYWRAALDYWSIAMSSCETALINDYGHKFVQGLSETGFFPLYMTGKELSANINDAGGVAATPFNFYLAKIFNNKYLSGYRYYQIEYQDFEATIYDLIWYDPQNVSLSFKDNMDYDIYYPNIATAIMRNGFFDNTQSYLMLHAGYNNVSHGHIDAGQFIYENGGVRWAIDLGSDNYNLFNYWQLREAVTKNRWCYYRCRAEGHNTWVINPDAYADQNPNSGGDIIRTDFDNTAASWAIADLSSCYANDAESIKRGMRLEKSDGSVIVRDEITLNDTSELYWFMHTYADIDISSDGKSAILTQVNSENEAKRLWIGIIDGSGEFSVMDAVPLPTSPNPNEWPENMNNIGDSNNPKTQATNTGVQKLTIHYSNETSSVMQTIYMTLLTEGENTPAFIPTSEPLNDWGI